MKRTWTGRLLDLLFPPKCPFCGRVLNEPGVCPKCEKTLPWIEEHLCERKVGQSCCAAPLWYEGAVRQALLRLKFHYAPGSAEPLGQLVARCAAEHFSDEFDMVTWVPVSRKRLRRRGYDQARLLAESACRCWDTKPVALLEKTEDNPAQSTLTEAAARRANVLGVYRALTEAAGRRILLIDDICTTGATLGECVRELYDAGAERVVCAAVALSREKKVHKNTEE